MIDSLDSYRQAVLEDVRGRIEALPYSHAALMREQIKREADAVEARFTAGALCMLTAESFEVPSSVALPAASALALLELSVEVMNELALEGAAGPSGLAGVWGMPRTLNAGDALFSLAEASIMDWRARGAGEAGKLRALEVFDSACRAASESLRRDEDITRVLLPAAVELGGLLAGLDDEAQSKLRVFGADLAAGRKSDLSTIDLSALGRERLVAAARSIEKGGGL